MPAAPVPPAAVSTATVPTAAVPTAATPKAASATPAAAIEKSKPGIGVDVSGRSVGIREGRTAIARKVVVSVRALIVVLSRRALVYRGSSDHNSEATEK